VFLLKIVHVITDLNVGGAEIMLLRLLELEAGSDNTVTVISLQDLGPVGKRIQALGIEVLTMNMLSAKDIPAVLVRLHSALKRCAPDVVQTWLYHADLLGGIAAKLAGVKTLVWGIHCSNVPLGNKTTKWVMKLNAFLSKFIPNKIVAVAQMSKTNHIHHGYDASKFVVIQNGFSVSESSELYRSAGFRQEFNLPESSLLIGVVGRYHPDKGQDVLLASLAKLLPDDRWHCIMLGRGCDEANSELMQLIHDNGLQERIRLVGEQDNVVRFMDNFDLFCLPSRSEAFPMVLGEAMTRGCCCISTDVGDSKDLLSDAGIIVPPGEPALLAAGIAQLLDMHPEQRNELGLRALNRIKNLYSIQKTVGSYHQLYSELVK
jgi:glycosyltransferase involved in cell wall biosynthesis